MTYLSNIGYQQQIIKNIMRDETIKQSLELHDYVMNTVGEECSKILKSAKEFHERYQIEKLKLPYHINIIDELHINENGHSRILTKLLMYQDLTGEYVFLQSLINYIKQHARSEEFDALKISQPIITQEFQRIDLWVRDKVKNGYAIIFENKVNNAIDQETQLSRYIEKTIKDHYKLDHIFVVYLSNSGDEPNDGSWGFYKEEFIGRYINLSFRDDIIPWLEKVNGSINEKDELLRCAITQYLDYLKGLFEFRITQKTFNMNIVNILKEKLEKELSSKNNNYERLAFINEKRRGVIELESALGKLELEYRNAIFKETEQLVLDKYQGILREVSEPDYSDAYAKVSFGYDGNEYVIQISYDGRLYCQVEYKSTEIDEQTKHQFNKTHIFSELSKNKILDKTTSDWCIWSYFELREQVWDNETVKNVCQCFETVVDKCVSIITK